MKRLNRKWLAAFAAAFALVLSLAIAACTQPSAGTFTLSFDTKGGNTIADITQEAGTEIDIPSDPVREGYVFDGWYAEEDCSGEAVQIPSVMPEENRTYYAKWKESASSVKAKIVLDTAGGSLAATSLELEAGADLYAFMQDYTPEKDGAVFGGWFLGGSALSAGTAMPAEGVSLTARYRVNYTVEIYKQATEGDGYFPDPASAVSGSDWEGAELSLSAPAFGHFISVPHDGTVSRAVLSAETGGVKNVFRFYYDREVYRVSYEANLAAAVEFRLEVPAGYEGEGDLYYKTVRYGAQTEAAENGFTAAGYRFVGWSADPDGTEIVHVGDPVEADGIMLFYAVWDRAYTDLNGGADLIYLPRERQGVAVLERAELGDKEGTYNPDTRIFTFAISEGATLEGRITAGERHTFSYASGRQEATYSRYDPFTGETTGETLALDGYDGAVYSRDGRSVTGLFAPVGDEYAFVSQTDSFLFRLDEKNGADVFMVRGAEAGVYYLALQDYTVDDYYALIIDGYGNATYGVYDYYQWRLSEGTYTVKSEEELTVSVEGMETFNCLYGYVTSTMGVYIPEDESYKARFESKDGTEYIERDGYGVYGYYTYHYANGSTFRAVAEYEIVSFTLAADGSDFTRGILRFYDEYTGALLNTYLLSPVGSADGGFAFGEVGADVGMYFDYLLTDSSIEPYFIWLDGEGGWTAYSFDSDGENAVATEIGRGVYSDDGGEYTLSCGDGTAFAPELPHRYAGKASLRMIVMQVSDSSTTYNVYIVADEANECLMTNGDTAAGGSLIITEYGIALFGSGEDYVVGTFTTEQDTDDELELAVFFYLNSITDGETYIFYLPRGIGDGFTFRRIGQEYGSYESVRGEYYGAYVFVDGSAAYSADGYGNASYGQLSNGGANDPYVVTGKYRILGVFEGTLEFEFIGETLTQGTLPQGMEAADLNFRFVLSIMSLEGYAFPVFIRYEESEDRSYTGADGGTLVVSGYQTATYTDADGNVYHGESRKGETDYGYWEVYILSDSGELTFRVDDESGYFMPKGAETGEYFLFEDGDRLNFKLVLDGYDSAIIYVPDEHLRDKLWAVGSYEAIGAAEWRFTPAPAYEKVCPAFSFSVGSFTDSYSAGYTEYPVYYRYDSEWDHIYVAADWSVLRLDGYGRASYIDFKGNPVSGSYLVIGEQVIRFTSSTTLFFRIGGASFELIEDEFVIENNVLLGYQGGGRQIVVPDGVEEIGDSAFLDSDILGIDLKNVSRIAEDAFSGCVQLETIVGNNVETIGDRAFISCESLTSVRFPKAVSLGRQSFAYCYFLAELELGDVAYIGDRAFQEVMTNPSSLEAFGVFKLILGNTDSAPQVGEGIFGIFGSNAYMFDIDFKVRLGSLDAVKAFYLDKAWESYALRIYFEEADEPAIYFETSTLDRLVFDGVVYLNGVPIGAYGKEGNTITLTGFDPDSGERYYQSVLTLDGKTLTGVVSGRESAFAEAGETLRYTNGEDVLTLVLGGEAPHDGSYNGNGVSVCKEGNRIFFDYGDHRYHLTLNGAEQTFEAEITIKPLHYNVSARDGSFLVIDLATDGSTVIYGELMDVAGYDLRIRETNASGYLGGNTFYVDTAYGDIAGASYRITITVHTEGGESYFTYEAASRGDSRTFVSGIYTANLTIGADNEILDAWLSVEVATQFGTTNSVRLDGVLDEKEVDGVMCEIFTVTSTLNASFLYKRYLLKPARDPSGEIVSLTVTEYTRRDEMHFSGSAEDGSEIAIDVLTSGEVTVTGSVKASDERTFTFSSADTVVFITESLFCVYTSKAFEETVYYRIEIELTDEDSFSYTFERAGFIFKLDTYLPTGEEARLYAYIEDGQTGYNVVASRMQIEVWKWGEWLLLDGEITFLNAFTYNFTVSTEGLFEGRLFHISWSPNYEDKTMPYINARMS